MGTVMRLGLALLCLAFGAMPALATDVPPEELALIRTPETKIAILAIAPRLINEGLVDTTEVRHSSTGLNNVGIGQPIYVAASEGSLTATGFTWSLSAKPEGSAAAIADAGDIGKTFTPDVAGDYTVTLVMTHSTGDTTLTQAFTAGTYVGAARCGTCHPTVYDTWKETNHARALEKKISGFQTGHFQERCIKCHSAGNNTSNIDTGTPDNGGFFDIAASQGWTFPTDLTQGTWTEGSSSDLTFTDGAWNIGLEGSVYSQFPDSLKQVSNITCEACHGPGSLHVAGGFGQPSGQKKIGVSLEIGVCAQCHDDGHYHVRPHEWAESGHGKTWTRDSASCAPCHLGSGRLAAIDQGLSLMDIMDGATPEAGSFQLGVTQTCATCHNPHSKANEHQVRWSGTVELQAMVQGQGDEPVQFTSIDLGLGAACAQCHHLRPGRNAVASSIHHSHQTEMLLGVGGYHYEGETYISGSHKYMENACVNCHMSNRPAGADPDATLGSHSWNMHDEETGDYNTTACESCHGPIDDFNVNGAKDEIHNLLLALGDVLPGSNGSPYLHDSGGRGSAPFPLTDAQKRAAWNWAFVDGDVSGGIHNFKYSRKLLVDALQSMGGEIATPVQGDFNGDNVVNFTDLFMLLSAYGTSSGDDGFDANIDLSGNGVIGFADWLMLLDLFGQQVGSAKPLAIADNGINVNGRFDVIGSNRRSIDSDHIAVTLRAQNMTQMRGYGVELTYDAERLEFVRALRADESIMPEDSAPAVFVKQIGEGRLMVADAAAGDAFTAGSGPLTDLVFKLLGPAGDGSVQVDLAQISDLNFGINRPGGAEAAPVAETFAYAMGQNFPNPFNPTTSIRYSLAEAGRVNIVVYNALGQEVRTLVDNQKLAGEYTANWDARDAQGQDVASGVYLYRMSVNGFTTSHRMVLTR